MTPQIDLVLHLYRRKTGGAGDDSQMKSPRGPMQHRQMGHCASRDNKFCRVHDPVAPQCLYLLATKGTFLIWQIPSPPWASTNLGQLSLRTQVLWSRHTSQEGSNQSRCLSGTLQNIAWLVGDTYAYACMSTCGYECTRTCVRYYPRCLECSSLLQPAQESDGAAAL